jgi:hypothetical protein
MPKSQFHIDDKLLQEHLKEVKSEMSWRRELEFRLLQFPLIFYSILGTAMVALFQSSVSSAVFWGVVAVASFLIIGVSWFVFDRIRHEHIAYAELGGEVQKIWTYYGFFKPGAYIKDDTILPVRLNEPGKGYGQGQGYKKTIRLIWFVSIALIVTLLALAVIKQWFPTLTS